MCCLFLHSCFNPKTLNRKHRLVPEGESVSQLLKDACTDFCSTSFAPTEICPPVHLNRPRCCTHTLHIEAGLACRLELIRLAALPGWRGSGLEKKSHLSAESATRVSANRMWTKLNFGINEIIPRLMCFYWSRTRGRPRVKASDAGWQITWVHLSSHSHC